MSEENIPQRELPHYQCHKKVWALKIKEVVRREDGDWELVPEDSHFAPIVVLEEFIRVKAPKAGGYWVRYEDGYESYSPAGAFESGYRLIENSGAE